MIQIEIPIGDYTTESMRQYCEHFGCKLLPVKRGDVEFKITTDKPVNFFWLGINMTLNIDNGVSISAASHLLKTKDGK